MNNKKYKFIKWVSRKSIYEKKQNEENMFEVNLRKSISIPLYMGNTYKCEASSAQSTIQYSGMTKGLFSKQ